MRKTIPLKPLDCGGCTECCKEELLVLHPDMGDRPQDYLVKTIINPLTGQRVFALAQKANGDCIYLAEQGCSIYEKRPAICREFDCRELYRGLHICGLSVSENMKDTTIAAARARM